MEQIHRVEVEKSEFETILDGRKKFLILQKSKGISVDDLVTVYEISNSEETGRMIAGQVTYKTDYAQKEPFEVISFCVSSFINC